MSVDIPANQAAMLCLMLGNDAPDTLGRMSQSRLVDGRVVHLARDMGEKTKAALLALGASFPEESEEDKSDRMLFPVQLPPGWSVKPTDHYMYSDLLDAQGRKRGSIGYKGPWDRWAAFYLTCRYRSGHEYAQHLPKDQMPPRIAALQVTEQVPVRVEIPEHLRKHVVMREHRDDELFYYDYGIRRPPTPIGPRYRTEHKTVEVNKFDPHRIKAHKSLPYLRYCVEDLATGERLWVSKWLSMNQVNQIERRKKVVYPSVRWLDKQFPEHGDVLAYW